MTVTIHNLDTHPTKYVTPEELAEHLHVNRRVVYHWIDKGALDARKFGGLIRIPIDAARAFASTPARP